MALLRCNKNFEMVPYLTWQEEKAGKLEMEKVTKLAKGRKRIDGNLHGKKKTLENYCEQRKVTKFFFQNDKRLQR